MHDDCYRTINDNADVVDLSYGPMQVILTSELNMQHVSAKFVLSLLITEHKRYHVEVSQDLPE